VEWYNNAKATCDKKECKAESMESHRERKAICKKAHRLEKKGCFADIDILYSMHKERCNTGNDLSCEER
jgi:hypothetical protein